MKATLAFTCLKKKIDFVYICVYVCVYIYICNNTVYICIHMYYDKMYNFGFFLVGGGGEERGVDFYTTKDQDFFFK